jgi:hypothetical protein
MYIDQIDQYSSSLSVAANVSASDSVYDLPVTVVGLTAVSISSQLITRMSAWVGYLKKETLVNPLVNNFKIKLPKLNLN